MLFLIFQGFILLGRWRIPEGRGGIIWWFCFLALIGRVKVKEAFPAQFLTHSSEFKKGDHKASTGNIYVPVGNKIPVLDKKKGSWMDHKKRWAKKTVKKSAEERKKEYFKEKLSEGRVEKIKSWVFGWEERKIARKSGKQKIDESLRSGNEGRENCWCGDGYLGK